MDGRSTIPVEAAGSSTFGLRPKAQEGCASISLRLDMAGLSFLKLETHQFAQHSVIGQTCNLYLDNTYHYHICCEGYELCFLVRWTLCAHEK